MPGPIVKVPSTSKLPGPIKGLVDFFAGDPTDVSNMASTPLANPVAAGISLLSKGQMLNNLLNHVEDLKGTIWEPAINALADWAPHVVGSIKKINPDILIPNYKTGKYALGRFRANIDPLKKFGGVGNIELNPHATKLFGNPAEVLGEEVGHAGQALMKGPKRFDKEYWQD